jgi:hypothetical protein
MMNITNGDYCSERISIALISFLVWIALLGIVLELIEV